MGDDRSDEDMFVAVNDKEYLKGMVRDGGDPTLRRSLSEREREEQKEAVEAAIDGPGHGRRDDEEEKWGDMDPVRTKEPPSPFTFTVCVGMKAQ